jgi:serum response factor
MDPNSGRGDSRYNLNYSMSMMNEQPEIYGNPNVSLARPGSGLSQVMSRSGGLMPTNNSQCGGLSRGIKRTNSDCFDDRSGGGLGGGVQSQYDCSINDVTEDSYTQLQPKKSPPSNGKKTKGRVKIKMEYIDNKLRRYTTFSKRKTGIMKKVSGFHCICNRKSIIYYHMMET